MKLEARQIRKRYGETKKAPAKAPAPPAEANAPAPPPAESK